MSKPFAVTRLPDVARLRPSFSCKKEKHPLRGPRTRSPSPNRLSITQSGRESRGAIKRASASFSLAVGDRGPGALFEGRPPRKSKLRAPRQCVRPGEACLRGGVPLGAFSRVYEKPAYRSAAARRILWVIFDYTAQQYPIRYPTRICRVVGVLLREPRFHNAALLIFHRE